MAAFLLVSFATAAAVAVAHADNDGYVSLELDTGSASAASHTLTTKLVIGKPEQRYTMLIDFESNEIDMRFCMRTRSYSFDTSSNAYNETSDVVMFADDSLLDPVKRGIYRLPVREHCLDLAQPPFVSPQCEALAECGGVLGLGPRSPVWVKWSAVTVTRSALHFGESNPHRLPRRAERVKCIDAGADNSASGLCEFSAMFAGRQVTVDFHSDDSYTYVPADIYQRYTEERNLYGFTNAQKRAALHLSEARHHAMVMATTDDEEDGTTLSRALFAERLANERQLATQYSSYYRNTHDITDRAEWPPLVVLPMLSSSSSSSPAEPAMQSVIVVDYDLLVFSPQSSGSYGSKSQRLSASAVPFAERSSVLRTLMLRPHANESVHDRVSLGNAFFRRYNLHKSAASNEIEIVERFASDNMSDFEALAGLFLYGYFLYAVCRAVAYSVGLALALNRRCPVCAEPASPYTRHRRPPVALVILSTLGDVLLLLVASWMLQHIETFLTDVSLSPDAPAFLFWSWLLAVPNVAVLVAVRLAAPAHAAPPDGTFCWRTFRWTVAQAACSEQVALLGLLWTTMILQTDTLGTTLSVFVGGAMFFSALHHAAHVLLFEHDFSTSLRRFVARAITEASLRSPLSRREQTQTATTAEEWRYNTRDSDTTAAEVADRDDWRKHRGNFPNAKANVIWFGFVAVVLLLFNTVFATFVTLRYISVPTLNSLPVAILIYAIGGLFGLLLLEVYEKITIVKSAFKSAFY